MRLAGPGQRSRPELIALLEAIATGRGDLPLSGFGSRTVAWAIEGGLGPLFHRSTRDNGANLTSTFWSDVKAADLTARIITAEQCDAMCEIIDGCRRKVPRLTLLKGISIAEEYYPEPHLRLMRDIDILVEKQSLPKVKAVLEQLQYRQRCDVASSWYDNHHHAAPFFHGQKNVWIEVHHGLISPARKAACAAVFQPQVISNQSRDSLFCGREVRRLSAELQLVYLATHWAQDFPTVGGVVAMVDAIYLLKKGRSQLDWAWIVKSVRGSVAAGHLRLLLSYLERYRLIAVPREVMGELSCHQPLLSRPSLAAAHAMLDRYCLVRTPTGRWAARVISAAWKALSAVRTIRATASLSSLSCCSAVAPKL